MNDWRNKLINFMVGRYGMDNLNKFIWWSGIALWLFGFILGIGVLSKLALAFLLSMYIACFRKITTKDITKISFI